MVIPATERGSKGYSTDVAISPEQAEEIRTRFYRTDAATSGLVLDTLPDHLSAEHLDFFATHGYLAACFTTELRRTTRHCVAARSSSSTRRRAARG
jgi:hypothetical protein